MLKHLGLGKRTVGIEKRHKCNEMPNGMHIRHVYGDWTLLWKHFPGDSDIPDDVEFDYVCSIRFCPYCGKKLGKG